MNIIVVEDEIKTARALVELIHDIRPGAKIAAQLQSVSSTLQYLADKQAPDLIFMDIHLSDGNCFDIFKSVKIDCPVIFCTAFDEYTLEAFKSNGIDYVLKPFTREHIVSAFEKLDAFTNFFQQNKNPLPEALLAALTAPAAKKSFLVFKNNKYSTVPVDNIAFFYIKFEATLLKCFDGSEYPVSQSLEQVQQQLSDKLFYRINRQYLVSFASVKDVEHYFARKLLVNLKVATPEKLLVPKEKATQFLDWLENR